MEREFHVLVREENGSYWAEVKELPGCFASGKDLEELKEAVIEAIGMYIADDDSPAELPALRIDEMRFLTPA